MSKDEYGGVRIRQIFAQLGGLEKPVWGMQARMSKRSGIDKSDISRLLDGKGPKRDLDRVFSTCIADEPKNTQAEFLELLGYCELISKEDKQRYEEIYLPRFPIEVPKQALQLVDVHRWYIQHADSLKKLRIEWMYNKDEGVQEILKMMRAIEEEMRRKAKIIEEAMKSHAEEAPDSRAEGE